VKFIALTGMVFGRWTVLSFARKDKHGRAQWLCRCEDGNEKVVSGTELRRGKSTSCGCLQIEQATDRLKQFQPLGPESLVTHGHTRGLKTTPEYRSWQAMLARCTNPRHEHYPDYGGRGITVCDRWQDSFEAFLEDMGPRPAGKTLDRYPDKNGNYEPGNCRWATWSEQNSNRRTWKRAA